MMRLAELQRAFQQNVLDGSREIESIVASTERFATAERLGVYSGGYAERLSEALAQTYPAVRAALGERRFASLIDRLAHTQPSRHFSVRRYGIELVELLASTFGGPKGSALAELARWEWLLAEVFDAADRRALTQADLAGFDPATWPLLRFVLTPTLRRARLETNAVQWWKWACAGAGAARPRRWRLQRPTEWVLWRQELAIYFRPLSVPESRALATIAEGETFGELCAALADLVDADEVPVRAATLLHTWLKEGWIVAVEP
jgi:hypothetical protein